MCPYHFAAERKLIPDHFPNYQYKNTLAGASSYHVFIMAFNFEKHAHCFACGIPQDRKKNEEGLSCHTKQTFVKVKACILAPSSSVQYSVFGSCQRGGPRWLPVWASGI
jgi:hypothetical protein